MLYAVCKLLDAFLQSDYVQYPQPTKGDRRFAAVFEYIMLVLSLRISICDIKSQGCCLDWDNHNHQAKWRSF